MACAVANCGPGRLDPWKKGLRPRRRSLLWPESFWTALCEKAKELHFLPGATASPGVPAECVEMIGDMNQHLYGRR